MYPHEVFSAAATAVSLSRQDMNAKMNVDSAKNLQKLPWRGDFTNKTREVFASGLICDRRI